MQKKFYTNGELDDNTGLTLSVAEFDDAGNITFGLMTNGIHNPGYMAKEVSEEEFNTLNSMLKDSSLPKGLGGLMSEEHFKAEEVKHKEAREVLDKILAEDKARLVAIAEKSGIPLDTLESFTKGKNK